MVLTEDKINHLSHLIVKGFQEDAEIDFTVSHDDLLRLIKHALSHELQRDDEADQFVRRKLDSYKKKMVEGSPEWEVLYRKFFSEEMKRAHR